MSYKEHLLLYAIKLYLCAFINLCMGRRFNAIKLMKCMSRAYSKKYAKAKRFSAKRKG